MAFSMLCYVVAVIFFVIAAFGKWSPAMAVGLAFFALGHVISGTLPLKG